jgi:hypothetical protein
MKSMNDLIHEHLLEQERGLSNEEILSRFYKMGNVDGVLAKRIVVPLLESDRRFVFKGGLWNAVQVSTVDELPLREAPYILFAIDEIEAGTDRTGDMASFELFGRGEGDRAVSLNELFANSAEYIFMPYDVKTLERLRKLYRRYSPLRLEMKTLSLRRLLSHFYPDNVYRTWDDIIRDFSLVSYEGVRPRSKTKTMLQVFSHLLDRAEQQGVSSAAELLEISNRVEPSINFSRYGFDREFLKSLPEKPGVYLFHNREDQVIYIGKTRNLRSRIGSYFRITGEKEEKRELILQHLYSIEYRPLGSDLEALVEEHRLIDRLKPVLNTQIRIPERKLQVPECIILLPSADEGFLKLYFLSAGAQLLDLEYRPGVDISGHLRTVREGVDSAGDPCKVIAMGYLKRYEEHTRIVPLDLYSDSADLVRVLDRHWENRQSLHHERVSYL